MFNAPPFERLSLYSNLLLVKRIPSAPVKFSRYKTLELLKEFSVEFSEILLFCAMKLLIETVEVFSPFIANNAPETADTFLISSNLLPSSKSPPIVIV